MALTYTEQQQVLNGDVKPPDMALQSLIGFIAVDYAIEFRANYKQFDTVDPQGDPINTDAQAYKNAIFALCGRVLNFERNRDGGLLNSFQRNFVALLARTQYTYSQITGASQSKWENFIKTGDPNSATGFAGIRLIYETIANTTREGRTAYDAI